MIDPLHHIEKAAQDTTKFMGDRTRPVLSRYPLVFAFLVVFGVTAVLYGFDSIIEQVPYLAEHPGIVFAIGLVILIFTGTLYKRLDRNLG